MLCPQARVSPRMKTPSIQKGHGETNLCVFLPCPSYPHKGARQLMQLHRIQSHSCQCASTSSQNPSSIQDKEAQATSLYCARGSHFWQKVYTSTQRLFSVIGRPNLRTTTGSQRIPLNILQAPKSFSAHSATECPNIRSAYKGRTTLPPCP